MVKTANHDEEKPTPPPADRVLIKAFIDEGSRWADQAKTQTEDAQYWRSVGHAEARAELEAMLDANRRAREAYVKDVGDRIVKAAEKAGQAVAEFLNKAYASAEERADQDQK